MPYPPRRGLYDPQFEHDSCGTGFVANIKGEASHDIVKKGIDILLNLVHRGACGCDPLTGDGAGIALQIPHAFIKRECEALEIELPEPGRYAVGNVFLPRDKTARRRVQQILEDKISGTGQKLLGWRDVRVNQSALGPMARASVPVIRQVLIGSTTEDDVTFERKLFVIRKWAERTVRESSIAGKGMFYMPSLSSRTIVYKGLLLAEQLTGFYVELEDPSVVSALAMVHQRFSTNTFPTWELAQPFRVLAHNGEINTVRGNSAWMSAREQLFDDTDVFGEDIQLILPTIAPGGSDSAQLDNVAELLLQGGRSLAHVMMMLVPEAWQNDPLMPEKKRVFYAYHSCLMEPWDGPAALTFTDGKRIGGILDRNGLRPARWTITKDGLVVLASETGVLDFAPDNVLRKGRLEPGRMFLVDTEKGRIVEDEEIKDEVCRRKPYGKWLRGSKIALDEIEASPPSATRREVTSMLERQKIFGYTQEDLRMLMAPMAASGEEAVGSMGTDTPLAVLSDEPQLLFNYFKQQFAQVTNPAIDPIREQLVMSLKAYIGGEGNLLNELPDQAQMLELEGPVLTNAELAKLRETPLQQVRMPPTLPMLYPVSEGAEGMKEALDELCRRASQAVLDGHSLVILSDRGATRELAPVPSLLATGAVHHHLMRNATRMRVGLIVETGEAREVHHVCLLAAYGAGAVNPYVAFETIDAMAAEGGYGALKDGDTAKKKYIKAINKGLLKVMSKMGISTLQSYQGAQIFEAIGLSPEVIDRYFTGTASRISGIDLDAIAEETRRRHERAFPGVTSAKPLLDLGGQYHFRAQGERHLWNPTTVARLQHAVRQEDIKSYKEYSDYINNHQGGLITLRGMWELVAERPPVPLAEVEPATEIVKRFATGAMSFGSISAEAHENLAIAMNRIGGRSNTGEGGEREERFRPDPNGDSRRSSIKQVASGRFGVTTYYLVNADELQIKVAQGAKPGEGGQLPGHKVDGIIAKTRHSTPGVTLISPPPHHDIYSIEDLAQLIFDLKMSNPRARISVKLVAEAGVGTVAAGVAKAHADVILISGHDGGTGASPLTSIKHAGVPWEMGIAETHQVLVKNDLRSRVILQADGQMRTGRDVVVAALLGAEEFGFATAPLVASGCIMMRKCHLNTCPVGVATQDPVLRAKFEGKPEHVIRFMFYVAEEARELMAALGFRTLRELVGHVESIKVRQVDHWKASRLDFSDVLAAAEAGPGVLVCKSVEQDHGLEKALDNQLIQKCLPALERREPVSLELPIRNVHRTVGAMLAGEVARRHGKDGLPPGTIQLSFRGSAGQSFGAFATEGMELSLEGDANDYIGKGLAGGILSVRPPAGATFRADENILIGNVAMYGATGGKAFFNGRAGERFCVRNSGAVALVEGVGDHGCEYMTGGRVVVLGTTGRNFAAGMSGGYAYVLDETGDFEKRCNLGMVELEALSSEDIAFVAALIAEHAERTSSPKAAGLLARWELTLPKFVKVVPTEYRRVVEDLQRREKGSAPTRPVLHP
jgi:glutamate synthase domain-containing protein 2/glutamate synthase domain-containing protein 1/glutamate synthase domain-containing protein 3